MNKYLMLFLNSILTTEGLSKNTLDAYKRDIIKLEEYFKNKDILYLEEKDLESYINYLSASFSPRTVDRNISSIKHFYDFLQLEKIIKHNPSTLIEHKKQKLHLPNFLTEEEIDKLLNKAKEDDSNHGIQFYCMLELLYATGMRVSELVSIENIEKDFNLKNNSYKIQNNIRIIGKGNKERIVPITENAIDILEKYLKLRDTLLNGTYSKYLFTTKVIFSKNKTTKIKYKKTDNHITRQVFARHLKDLAISIGINPEKISPHIIRHSIATHLLKNGVDIRIIQQILGHADISTTQIYTHINNNIAKKTIENYHPLAKVKNIEL